MMNAMKNIVKAAIIIIGNEILSGRTQDKNINHIAVKLTEQGIRLVEVRVIPDIEEKIIAAIHELKDGVDYIFTCGGIGPTHDDITAECVAKAFGVELEMHSQAYAILEAHYGVEQFTDARKKMAKIPVGADLILNPVSAAPGFVINHVYVMAGVPRIMQAMLDNILVTLKGGDVVHSLTVSSSLPESAIAQELGEIQLRWPEIDIGSYPYFKDGNFGVSVVLRGVDEEMLGQAAAQVQMLVDLKMKK
jgi:molybdenum cofactor synthesis domain-containing protein